MTDLIFNTFLNDFSYLRVVYHLIYPDRNVLYLTRLDGEKQSVALYKAKVSGDWHVPNVKIQVLPKDMLDECFDIKAIYNCMNDLESDKIKWESFFVAEGIEPVRVNYEDFECDVENMTNYILQHLNIDSNKVVASKYNKLSDEISEKWVSKLKEYRRTRS